MIKNQVELKRNEKFEMKIRIACDFHSAKYEFIRGRILKVDKVNVSFIEPHRFLIKLNGQKIVVLYFDEDNMFLYNRRLPIDMKKLNLILDTMKEGGIMEKSKLGMSSFDIDIKFKDRDETYKYAERFIQKVNSICKQKNWSVTAMVCISNTEGNSTALER